MTRLILALATLMTMSACSGSRDRTVQANDESANTARDLRIAEPDTAGRADSIALASRGTQPVSPVEQAPRSEPPAPRKKPLRSNTRPAPARPPVDTTATAPDTAARGYAPAVADTASGDTAKADTARTPALDTATTAVRDSASPPAASSDTMASRAPAPDTTTTPANDSSATAARTATPDTTSASSQPSPSAAATSAAGTADKTLPIGAQIHAALDDSISSRRDSAGRTVTAQVTENVTGSNGQILIPAGSTVQLTVTKLGSSKSKNSPGQLVLRVDGIQLGGAWKKLQADIQPVSRELRGRGVTGSDAAKVGVGAAGGAVLGRVLGGSTKGAVIGGVVGAAGGAVVASQTATRDVVVKAKTPLVFTLTAPLVTP
jgi:hypothetical protein